VEAEVEVEVEVKVEAAGPPVNDRYSRRNEI
jgi:hypothetical protein